MGHTYNDQVLGDFCLMASQGGFCVAMSPDCQSFEDTKDAVHPLSSTDPLLACIIVALLSRTCRGVSSEIDRSRYTLLRLLCHPLSSNLPRYAQ